MTDPKNVTTEILEMARIFDKLGAPPDTDRARIIRAKGLEAVAKALEETPAAV